MWAELPLLFVVFSFPVLPDGESREEEAAPDRLHLYSRVQPAHDHSRLCPGKICDVHCLSYVQCHETINHFRSSESPLQVQYK